MSATPVKRTMLIDFTFRPTNSEPTTWYQVNEQQRFKCGIKDNLKNYDAPKASSGIRPPSTIFLLSMYPKRKGFIIYQVHYAVVPGSPTKRMVKRDKVEPHLITVYTAEDDNNLEGKNIRIWIYLSEVIAEYSHSPIDQRIHRDLWNAAENRLFTDVDLEVGNKTFPAHRAILAARSPVFAAMFNTDMMESRTRCVEIKDIRPEIFESFLKFVYTGSLQAGADNPELLLAADKYQVETLKNLCEAAGHDDDTEECASLIVEALL